MFLKWRLLINIFNSITLNVKWSFKAWHLSPLNYLGFREWIESFWLKKRTLYFRMNVCVRKIFRKLNDSNIRQGWRMKWTFWDNILQENDFYEIAFDTRESLFNTLISNSSLSLWLSFVFNKALSSDVCLPSYVNSKTIFCKVLWIFHLIDNKSTNPRFYP